MEKQQLIDWLQGAKRRVLLAAIVLGSFVTVLIVSLFTLAGQEEKLLTENFFRFHVLASSDSEEDQALKLKVRDAVLAYLKPQLTQSKSKEETKALILEQLPQITDIASRTLRQAGSRESVQAVVGVSDFPRKSYGNVTLPAGRY